MKFTGTIKSVGAMREGTSKSTGEKWAFTPVVMEWKETNDQTLAETTHSVCMDVRGMLDVARCKQAIDAQEEITFTLFFDIREYNGKIFTDIKGYLPKDFIYKGF